MEQIIDLLYEIAQNAPAFFALITLVALIGAAVLLGSDRAGARRIRESINELVDSFERSERLLREAGESARRVEDGVEDISKSAAGIRARIEIAENGVAEALALVRGLQNKADNDLGDRGGD